MMASRVSMVFAIFAFFIFHKGLKRYSSSNLMVARVISILKNFDFSMLYYFGQSFLFGYMVLVLTDVFLFG